MHLIARLLALLILSFPSLSTAADCGSGGRCVVDEGYYLAKLPADWDGKSPLPLVVFFHGYNSAPENMMRHQGMVDGVTGRGAIFVTPYAERGAWRQSGDGRAQRGRDELAYIRRVLQDIKRRWPVDENRMLATGFSLGGSMVWNIACYAGDLFTAYLPIAGGFWQSTPEACPAGPLHLRHIHGLKDDVVPHNRVGPYTSMPMDDAIDLVRQGNSCKAGNGVTKSLSPRLQCSRHDNCTLGGSVEYCLHPGGHSVRGEWVAAGLEWMMSLN